MTTTASTPPNVFSLVALGWFLASCTGGPAFDASIATTTDAAAPSTAAPIPSDASTGPDAVSQSFSDAGGPKAPYSCKRSVIFTAHPINPPTTPTNVCTAAVIGAIADACMADPASVKTFNCATARANAPNVTCANCIFGSATDAKWKVINVEEGKSATFNQAGCIDHVTGIPGCGAAHITILRCNNTFCPLGEGSCPSEALLAKCVKDVETGECKQHQLGNNVSSNDTACATALQTKSMEIDANCFAADNTAAAEKTFFFNMVATSCMKQ